MIYTITLNPSIDYYLTIPGHLIEDEVNRGTNEIYKAGGKGLNVSRILSLHGLQSTAVCLLGGFTGQYIEAYFASYPLVHVLPVKIQGINRINIKASRGTHSLVINGSGPLADGSAKDALMRQMDQMTSSDYVIVSGSLMRGLTAADLTAMCETVHKHHACLVMDMELKDTELLKQCRPDIIKPNLYELKKLLHDESITSDNIPAKVQPLRQAGISDVLVSLGAEGAVLVTKEGTWKMDQPHIILTNKAGAGDAMLASYIARIVKGSEKQEALRYAGAAGNAAAAKVEDITYQDIEEYLPLINVSALTSTR